MIGPIVVLYHRRGDDEYPMRSTIEDHLFAWRRYSRFDTVYVNVAYPPPLALVGLLRPVAVVFHTSLLSIRWSRERFQQVMPALLPVRQWSCAKVAMPQDEFTNTDLLDDFLTDVGVTHLLTCASERDWPRIYPRTSATAARFETVLTGYLDEGTVERVSRLPAPRERPIDVGYRAWRASAWLGSWGQHKVQVATVMAEAARARGLRTDISLGGEDTLLGDDWFRFLLDCRATVGVEGGSSVLDADGSLKERVSAYEAGHPDADFDQVAAACLDGRDGSLELRAISPRHLEACLTRTAQVLVEGHYNGVLQAGLHYFPLKEDYSNLDDALQFLGDRDAVSATADRAYRDVVESGRYTYRNFVQWLDETVGGTAAASSGGLRGRLARVVLHLLGLWDRAGWLRIRVEARWLRRPDSRVGGVVRWVYRAVKRTGKAG